MRGSSTSSASDVSFSGTLAAPAVVVVLRCLFFLNGDALGLLHQPVQYAARLHGTKKLLILRDRQIFGGLAAEHGDHVAFHILIGEVVLSHECKESLALALTHALGIGGRSEHG